jgi:hypothetical protein
MAKPSIHPLYSPKLVVSIDTCAYTYSQTKHTYQQNMGSAHARTSITWGLVPKFSDFRYREDSTTFPLEEILADLFQRHPGICRVPGLQNRRLGVGTQ